MANVLLTHQMIAHVWHEVLSHELGLYSEPRAFKSMLLPPTSSKLRRREVRYRERSNWEIMSLDQYGKKITRNARELAAQILSVIGDSDGIQFCDQDLPGGVGFAYRAMSKETGLSMLLVRKGSGKIHVSVLCGPLPKEAAKV